MIGQKINFWEVLSFSHASASHKQYYNCRCKCGVLKTVESYNLKSGRSKMCRKCSALIVGALTHATHRLSGTKIYSTWQSIKTRCYNEKAEKCYKYHGALGVKVSPLWINDFEAFYAYVGEPPSPHHTIDRINPFGDYEPGNVRWATQSEQMNNTRVHVNPERYRRLKKKMGIERKKYKRLTHDGLKGEQK